MRQLVRKAQGHCGRLLWDRCPEEAIAQMKSQLQRDQDMDHRQDIQESYPQEQADPGVFWQ